MVGLVPAMIFSAARRKAAPQRQAGGLPNGSVILALPFGRAPGG
jgi:hypothetical protein